MKIKVINTILFVSLFCLVCSINAQNKEGISIDRKTKNLLVFYRTYVSVRLFYPNKVNINWDKYAVAGARLALNSKTDKELITNLNKFFIPFFPTVYLSNTKNNINTPIKPLKNYPYSYKVYSGYKIYYGLSKDEETSDVYEIKSDIYDNTLLTIKDEKDEKELNLKYPIKNQQFNELIVDDITLQFNIISYKEKNTLSNQEDEKLKRERSDIRNTINKISLDKVFYQEIGIANLLWMMGIIEHFYPYHEQIQTPYKDLVIKYLNKSILISSYSDFFLLYRQFISEINDGHADVLAACFAPLKKPKIGLEYYSKHVIVCNSKENNINIGDTIIKIDNKPVHNLIDSLTQLYSGSEEWKIFRILNEELLYGVDTALCNITILKNGQEIENVVNRTVLNFKCDNLIIEKELPNNGFYFNLTEYVHDSVDNIISALKTKQYVIFDLRGYPIDSIEEFVLPLLSKDTLYSSWFYTPLITAENNFSHFDSLQWFIPPNFVENSKADIFFLSSEKAISYTESLLDIISYYKLGIIVGQNTAGSDGNYSIVRLPQHFLFTYTGMRLVRLNGELLQSVGIIPDIKVKKKQFSKDLLEDDVIKEVLRKYD